MSSSSLASTTTRPPLSSIILTLASSSPAPSRGRKAQLKKPCPSLKRFLIASLMALCIFRMPYLCIYAILYFGSLKTTDSGSIEGSTADEMIGESTETNEALSITSHDAAKKLSKSSPSLQEMSQENGNSVRLSLVKLTKSGLLLFVFPNDKSLDTTDIVSSIFQSLESGSLKPPRWCCRIFPIQATCNLNEKELHAVVLKLVREFVQGEKNKLTRPVKYAVGFNRRGIGEKELKTSNYSNNTGVGALLDRNKCFEVVGSAVKDVIPDSVVDLNNPELSILVELLPLSGVPNGSPVVAVAVLPPNFVVTKPKLCVKALLSSSNMTDKAL
ncbi:unnamed protein product [Rhodiola kirilowii]